MKVLKFGGTSMANAANIRKVCEVISAGGDDDFIVVSAPGVSDEGHPKVTDMLYACYDEKMRYGIVNRAFRAVEERFFEIAKGLGADIDLQPFFDDIKSNINGGAGRDYTASRGEFLTAKILSAYLFRDFIDAENLICFDESGEFDLQLTMLTTHRALLGKRRGGIIPGFYGAVPNGEIKTFSRGGSDVTGAVIAGAVEASVYENWTDVDGFYVCDPKIINDSRLMTVLSYEELRELSYAGAKILHSESIFPLKKRGIPICIKNTFNIAAPGTVIVPSKCIDSGQYTREDCAVTGISGKKGFASVFIEKPMMNGERRIASDILGIFARFGVSIDHIPTGIDTLSVVFDKSDIRDDLISRIVSEISRVCCPENIEILTDLAVVAVTGRRLGKNPSVVARVYSALADEKIDILASVQNINGLGIILVVNDSRLERCIRAIYDECAYLQESAI